MTDFLDLLEADLREAAERRGQPQPRRHRPPKGAFKAIVALAVIALFVFAAARVLDRVDTERAAEPTPSPLLTPTPFPPSDVTTVVATEGNPALLDVMSATLGGYLRLDRDVSGRTADPSLGTVVLYRSDRANAEAVAETAAFAEKIDEERPITKADEDKLDFPAGSADVIVVYGRERQQQMLDNPKICAPAGGAYKLCLSRSDEARYSTLVQGDMPVLRANGPPESWLSWAALSPDGKSLLVETSNRCEYPRSVVWANGEMSPMASAGQPLGWTTDGRAIVFVPQPKPDAAENCRAEQPVGLYLVKPGETPTRVGDNPVPRSIDPRTPQELTG